MEYNRTVYHKPIPTNFAVMKVSKDFYGIDAEPWQKAKIASLRKFIYENKNSAVGAAFSDINTSSGRPSAA